jgi:DNA repair protein RecN (Recombination protein N)
LFDAFYSLEKYAKDLSLWDDEDRVLKFNEALGFLNDIRREVQNLKQGSDEVVELSLLEERLRRIKDLIRKHRVLTADELVQKQRDIEDRLEHMRLRETKLAELESEVVKVEGQLVQIGESLHSKRIEAGKVIEKMLLDYLERVDLPKAHLKLNWESHSNPTKSGLYKPVFMFSANPGKLMEPLHKVASGGEQSRVKLALKAVLGEYSQLSCQIFDEIDTGISGSTAERIGSLMKTMAKSQQIIAITHLPQVAAAGTEHWKVMKQQDENDTVSTVQILSAEERIEEVARLMSGQKITDVAKKQAQALLSQS